MKTKTLGIIGGDGKMGELFRRLFEKYVDEVLISSLNTQLTNVELVQKSQVILICVPISEFDRVIDQICPYVTADKLLIDITSLKSAPCKKMLETKGAIIGTHPMFGPSVKQVEKQTIVLCPVRENGWKKWLIDIFEKEKAILVECEAEEHDKMMGIVQGLTHFLSLTYMSSMRHLLTQPLDALEFATPMFRMQLYLALRVLSQSGEMYADIQMENPFFPQVLEGFENAFRTLKEIVLKKDKSAFLESFGENAKNFGPLKEEAQQMTSGFIEMIVKRATL